MIRTAIFRVRPEKLERLTAWLAELQDRAEEVRETFAREGVTAQRASFGTACLARHSAPPQTPYGRAACC